MSLRDETWADFAACAGADPRLFFPDSYQNVTAATAYCHRCEVKPECLAHAMADRDRRQHGVWGATTPKQRDRMKRRQSIEARAEQAAPAWR